MIRSKRLFCIAASKNHIAILKVMARKIEMQIRPLYDRIIVKRVEIQRATASGPHDP